MTSVGRTFSSRQGDKVWCTSDQNRKGLKVELVNERRFVTCIIAKIMWINSMTIRIDKPSVARARTHTITEQERIYRIST